MARDKVDIAARPAWLLARAVLLFSAWAVLKEYFILREKKETRQEEIRLAGGDDGFSGQEAVGQLVG